MKRIFFSGESRCPSNCDYCFAKWNDLYKPFPEINDDFINDNKAIVYPCCDSDFFMQQELLEKVTHLVDHFDEIFISISTKNDITHDQIENLLKLDKYLKESKKGFVKISVSFSTKYLIDKLEKDTLSYEKRIELLKELFDCGFNTSVIIKPMLPFLPIEEYQEIVRDTLFLKKYLIGSLYVNLNSDFYKEYIQKNYYLSEKPVDWMPKGTQWKYIEQKSRENELKYFIESNNATSYDSDIELIKSYLK